MEYLDGETLKDYLKVKKTLTPGQALKLMMPIMLSLKEVHKQGLIHRDISPDNIMLVGNDVKLLDFGSARTVTAIANRSLSVMLKPGYAPEEQYRSKGDQGAWTDVYAICATMYRCITGIIPDDSVQRAFKDEIKTPTALGIEINPDIEYALMKGLSVLQKDRYQNIEQLLDGFRGIDRKTNQDHEITVYAVHHVSEDELETQYIAPNEVGLGEEKTSATSDSAATDRQDRDTYSEHIQFEAKTDIEPKSEIAPVFRSETQPEQVSPPAPKSEIVAGTESKIKPETITKPKKAPGPVSESNAKPRKKRISIVLASAIMLIVVIVGVYMLIRKPGDVSSPPSDHVGTKDSKETEGSIVPTDVEVTTTTTEPTIGKEVRIIPISDDILGEEMIGKVYTEEHSFFGDLHYTISFPIASKDNSMNVDDRKTIAFAGLVDEESNTVDGIVTIYKANSGQSIETYNGHWETDSAGNISISDMLYDDIFTGYLANNKDTSTSLYTYNKSNRGAYVGFSCSHITYYSDEKTYDVIAHVRRSLEKEGIREPLEFSVDYQATTGYTLMTKLFFDGYDGSLFSLRFTEFDDSDNIIGSASWEKAGADTLLRKDPIINISELSLEKFKEISYDVVDNKFANLTVWHPIFVREGWDEFFEKRQSDIELALYMLKCVYNKETIVINQLNDFFLSTVK